MAKYVNKEGKEFTSYKSFIDSMNPTEIQEYVQDMIDGKAKWPSKGNLKNLCTSTYSKLSPVNYDNSEKLIAKISEKLNAEGYVVARVADNGKNGMPIVTRVNIKSDKKNEKTKDKNEDKDKTNDTKTNNTTTDKKEDEKKKKERVKFWNTISNGFFLGVLFGGLLCAFGLGMLGMPLMMLSLLGTAVTKGIAYQGGFGLTLQDLENFKPSEKEKAKKLAKEYDLSRKQTRENKKYKNREKGIKNLSEEISKIEKDMKELDYKNVSRSAKEYRKLLNKKAKLSKKMQGLKNKNSENLDKATPSQLLALLGERSKDGGYRKGFGEGEIYSAMIRNCFSGNSLDVSGKFDQVLGQRVERTALSHDIVVLLSEMTKDERDHFMEDVKNYAKNQTDLIQAYQLREPLVEKEANVKRLKSLKRKSNLTNEEQLELDSLEHLVDKNYFTKKDKERLNRYTKIINDTHAMDDDKRVIYYNEVVDEATKNKDSETLQKIELIKKLKNKDPKTKEEEKLLAQATTFITNKINAKNVAQICKTKNFSLEATDRDINDLKRIVLLMDRTTTRIDEKHIVQEELIALEERFDRDPQSREQILEELNIELESYKGKNGNILKRYEKKAAIVEEEKEWLNMSDEELLDLDKNLEEKINKETDLKKKKELEERRKRMRQKNKLVFKEEIKDRDFEDTAVIEDIQWVEEKREYAPTGPVDATLKAVKEGIKESKDEKDKKKKGGKSNTPSGNTYSK